MVVGKARQRRKPLAIKWKKEDVINKFREAMTAPSPEPQAGQRPKLLQTMLDKAKAKSEGKTAEVKEAA